MRIFLIGLSDAFARSLARYVSTDERVVLCGAAPDLALASIMLPATQAALALVDWAALDAAPGSGLLALRASCHGLKIVCVVDDAQAYREQALAAGADTVTSREGFAAELELLLGHLFEIANRRELYV